MTIHMPVASEMRADPDAIPARVVGLSNRQSAIFFDADVATVNAGARLAALCDGRPFEGPVAITRLGRSEGGTRHAFLVARAAAEICNASVRIEASGRLVARIDPLALQSPLVDPLALLSGLDEAGSLRLLKLLLTTGASLFGKGEIGGFGALVGQLVESLARPIPLSAWCAVGASAGILSWRLPEGFALPTLRTLCILHNGRAHRFTEFEAIEEQAGAERLLHLLTSRALPDGAELIVLGEHPVRFAGPAAAAARPVRAWLERRAGDVRARTLDWLDGLASVDASMTTLRDELACPADAEPRAGVLELSATPEGLLYLLSVEDPRGLLRSMRLSVAGENVEVRCDRLEWHAEHGSVAVGYARLSRRGSGVVTVTPVFLSGRIGTSTRSLPPQFDGKTPKVFQGLDGAIAASVLAEAMPAALRARPIWRRRVATFGMPPTAPGVAILVAAGDAPEHLHLAIAALLAEPGGRCAEIVVHHADGPASELVRQTVASLAAVNRLGIRLVAVAADSFPSERLRAALAETRAAKVLSLGPGATPSAPGWLAAWRRRIGIGTTPMVAWVKAAGCSGADTDAAAGFNAAAVAQLVAARPNLPDITPDIRATPGMRHTTARGLSVTVFGETVGCSLTRTAQGIALETLQEAANA